MSNTVDAVYNYYRLSDHNLMVEGVMYSFHEDVTTLAAGASYTISLQTGAYPVYLNTFAVQILGSNDIGIKGYVGGAVSGGSAITSLYQMNHHNPQQSPWVANSLYGGRTVDTVGTMFSQWELINNRRVESTHEMDAAILKPNSLYYWTYTNNDTSTAELHGRVVASTIL